VIFTVLSADPVASYIPLGEKLTAVTVSLWSIVIIVEPVDSSVIFAVLSADPVAR